MFTKIANNVFNFQVSHFNFDSNFVNIFSETKSFYQIGRGAVFTPETYTGKNITSKQLAKNGKKGQLTIQTYKQETKKALN